MAELQLKIIIYGSVEMVNSYEFLFPIPMSIVHDISSLDCKINNISKQLNGKLQRYFILFLESIETDEDNVYQKLEDNPQIIIIFRVCNESFMPTLQQKKVYYIRQDLVNIALTCNIIEFMKNEAKTHTQLNQIALAKIYLRKAQKTKEWLISTIRAEPCHILIIPLNTNSTNLIESKQYLLQYCAKLGYPSAIIRSLDDYIPKSEIYDKLPYGKQVFEYEHPTTISRWLRILSPIRFYLYGNEQVIPSEWSKQMIANEIDHVGKRIVNDDDWCTFIENEPINDDIKWNFAAKHGRSWQITQLTPIKLCTLEDNIRFRSALRRSNMTFHTRQATVTAQIYGWFDECIENSHIQPEFKLIRSDRINPLVSAYDRLDANMLSIGYSPIGEMNFPSANNDKNESSYMLTYSSNQSNELINYYSSKSDRTYIWLDTEFYLNENRFQKLIYPHQWKYFSNISECQTFIQNQQLQYNAKIYLLSKYSLAEQLFAFEHISKIYAAYLYSNQNEIFPKWISSLPRIRGIYHNFDSLYEQFSLDIINNIELVPTHHKQQENDDPLPIGFFDSSEEGFKCFRIVTDILLKLSATLEARQNMIAELRRTANQNNILIKQINDFEQNYQPKDAIQWYTRESFVYRIINEVLRSNDVRLEIKYGCFIVDLYERLSELHDQIIHSNNYSEQTIVTYYRGQLMSLSEIDQFKQNIGSCISINTFFSTSLSLDIAVMFAGGPKLEGITPLKPVIFSIEVDPVIKNTRPFAHITNYSVHTDEEEVLFALGSVFRIEKVDVLSVNDNVLVIHLKMIDESELPQNSFDFSKFLTEQTISDPIYALVGLTSLFQINEQCEHIKSILEEINVQFFDNTDDLDHYMKSIKAIQPFVIFIHEQSSIPEHYQQTKMISYAENDMHFNDLTYQLLYEMNNDNKLQEHIKDLYMNVANVYGPANESNFYVQLLLSSTSKKTSEEQLKTRFPSSSIVTFYQTESCMNFLQSITEPSQIGNAILILQCDDKDIDHLIDQLEQIDSIKYMYICSRHPLNIKYRRIIHGKFQNENDLYTQLYSDHLFDAFVKTNRQSVISTNENETAGHFQQTEQYYRLLKEQQNQEKNNLD